MSWQGQVNQPIGIAGIDSNGKIHALDASQLFNLNANNISSGTIAIARLPNGGVNGVSQLIQLNASGNFPTLNASALTNLSAANIVGTISTSNFSKATTSTVGVVQIGSNINISAGVISIPAATTSVLGVGQPDGVTTTISGGLLVVNSVTSVPNLSGGAAGDLLYQSVANTTGFLSASNGVVIGNSGTPAYTITPTLIGTNFSGVPNSATTATSTNTASAIVARDSNGDFSTHDFTVVGDLIGDMVNYNAYDPTIIAGSSTLGTNVSMIIATGSASVSETFSITGGTTNPPLYALDASSLPTVSSMTVAANVATATANNASAQTFDYVTMNNIIQVTPTMKFTSGNVLTVDPTSTIGNLKLTGRVVTVGQQLLVDDGTTVAPITVSAVTTNPITAVENFSITGGTDTPPTYAFNAIRVPTVVNGTVVGNTFVANANNASAATLDYSPGGSVSAITPKMTFTNGNVLSVDPSSTTGSTKFNYSVSNTVQVGSKIQVDVAGTVSEITVAAGSQSSNSVFDSSWGALKPFEVNGLFFLTGTSPKLASSPDGNSWTYLTTLPLIARAMCYFNGKYYIGGVGSSTGTASIYSSSDLVNWTIAHTITLGRVISSWVATDGIKLIAAYSGSAGDVNSGNNAYYIYSSTDGIAYTQRVNQTTGTGVGSGVAETRSLFYANGKFIYANFANSIAYSNEGTSWTILNNPRYANGYVGGAWYSGSLFCISSVTGATNTGTISTSPDFSVWTDKITGLTDLTDNFVQNGSTVIALAQSPLTAPYSTDSGATWSTGAAMVSRGRFGLYSTILSKYIAQVTTSNGHIQTTTSPTIAWTDVNMTTGNGYQFTMTSPSIAKPDWAALGGQTEQYSVTTTSTPSFIAATTPTYTRSGNVITATYAQATGTSGVHVQLKAATLNSGDILSQIGADLTYQTGTEYVVTSPSLFVAVPTWVALGGQAEEYSVSPTSTPSFTAATSPTYTRSTNDITVTYAAATPVAYPHLQLKASGFNSGDILTQIGADLQVGAGYTVNIPDADTFPVSQLGQSIYYVNNSSGINTVESTTGYVNTSFSITGATTNPPTYALDNTSLPTVTNVTIAGDLATAIADNASVQTFDYVAVNNILQVTPKITFTNGNVLEVDPSSTSGSLKLNYNTGLQIDAGMSLVFDIYDTPGEYTVAAGSQVTYSNWSATGNFSTYQQYVFYPSTPAYANGVFLISNGANGGVLQGRSTDNGETWQNMPGPFWYGVGFVNCAYGDGVWLAGSNIYNAISKSTDNGATFSRLSTPPLGGFTNNQTPGIIAYGAGRFVYASNNGQFASSTDFGASWTTPSSLPISMSLGSLFYFLGNQFIIVTPNNTTIALSDDGISWTTATLPLTGSYSGIAYGAGLFIIVRGNTNAMSSPDGITWSTITLPRAASGIAYGNGMFMTVSGQNVNTSVDGVNWTGATASTLGTAVNGIIYGDGVFIAYKVDTGTAQTNFYKYIGYSQFTMTSPVLPAVPTWAALGGQTMQYSVSSTSIPSFTNTTMPVITRVGNDMTITYAAATPTAAPHLQLKALGLNNGDILRQIGADLHVFSNIVVTIPPGGKYALTPTLTEGWQTLKFAG